MASITLANANKIYELSEKNSVYFHTVECEQFKEYCFAVQKLKRAIREEMDDEELLRTYINFYSRYRYEIISTPLPFDNLELCSKDTLNYLRRKTDQCATVFPHFGEEITELFNSFILLFGIDQNPLLSKIMEITSGYRRNEVAVLIKDVKLLTMTEKWMRRNRFDYRFQLVDLLQLRGLNFFKRLIILGAPLWYRDHQYVLSVPHAKEIHFIGYEWMKNKWPNLNVFAGSATVTNNDQPNKKKAMKYRKRLILDPEDILLSQTYDWNKIRSGLSFEYGLEESTEIETIEARLLLLEGFEAVYVDASSESAKALIIDLYEEDEDVDEDGEASSLVMRIPANDIIAGMFIVLRTEGGGDYIVQVADNLLGKKATAIRAKQSEWKSKLKNKVSQLGMDECVNLLGKLGSSKANEANVKNWMSERNIKPRSFVDFTAIMQLVEIEGETDTYWNNAELIDRAHRSAGFTIRKLLLKELFSVDRSELFRKGRINFELQEGEGGSLTAFRVLEISPSAFLVPLSQINHVFRRSDNEWQE